MDSMVAPTSIARAHGGVWESIPFTGGLVRNIHNGRVVHEQHFAKNKAANEFLASSKTHTDAADLFYDGTRRNPVTPQGRAPPTIHLRCHDIAGATHPTTVSIEPELVWREVSAGRPNVRGGWSRKTICRMPLIAPMRRCWTSCRRPLGDGRSSSSRTTRASWFESMTSTNGCISAPTRTTSFQAECSQH